MITQNERHSLGLAKATVSSGMSGFAATDYARVKDLIELGHDSAASQSTALLPYAIRDPAEWQDYLAVRAARRHQPPTKVEAIEVTGADSDTDQRIQHRLGKALRYPLDLSKLDTQLTRIAGEGQFDRLGYEGFTQNGVPALRVTTHDKSYGPPFVDLAVNVDGSGVAAFDFSAGARLTFMDIAHHGGEWRNDLLFGSAIWRRMSSTASGPVAIFCFAVRFCVQVCPKLLCRTDSGCGLRGRARRWRLRYWL